jgi:hypothetical protein
MAFKTFAPGVLTSSDVNTFLMRQSIIVCTSSTRPASPNEGMTIYETDTKLYQVYSGTTWQILASYGQYKSYTPALISVGTGTDWVLGNGTISGAFARFGNLVHGYAYFIFGSTSVAGSKALNIGGPVNHQLESPAIQGDMSVGLVVVKDVSTNNGYPGVLRKPSGAGTSRLAPMISSTTLAFVSNDSVTAGNPITFDVGDVVVITFTYEAAA